jgi:phosphohistidine phosphatase SixA
VVVEPLSPQSVDKKEWSLANAPPANRESKMKMLHFVCAALLLLLGYTPANATDLPALLAPLTQGGYVLVFRHVATDDSQKDAYPFNFDDMKAQRQLSDKGRETARQIGAAIRKLGVPVGDVYTSRLYRAVETGKLLFDKDVKPVDALTDSSAGAASGMANPTGGNAKAGRALRELVDAPPKAGTNSMLVTHKTNITDAFGKEASDVQDGEAFVYKASAAGPAVFVARIKAAEWIAQAGN